MVGFPNNHGFSYYDHFGVFWGTPIFGNTHMEIMPFSFQELKFILNFVL